MVIKKKKRSIQFLALHEASVVRCLPEGVAAKYLKFSKRNRLHISGDNCRRTHRCVGECLRTPNRDRRHSDVNVNPGLILWMPKIRSRIFAFQTAHG